MLVKLTCGFARAVRKVNFNSYNYTLASKILRTRFCSTVFVVRTLNSMTFPKGVICDWDLNKFTPEKIKDETQKLIDALQKKADLVGSVALTEATYDTVVKPLEVLQCDIKTLGSVLDMPQHCVADKALRDASSAAEEKMEEFNVALNMRADLFERVLRVQKSGMEDLSAEEQRFVDKLVIKGRRHGLHLPPEIQKQVKELKTKESELSIKFSSNLNEDDTKLHFKKDDLSGLPEDLIDEFEEGDDGLLEVTIKYNHLFPVVKKCRVPATRKAMVTAANRKCMKENTPILEDLVRIRHKIATLLGYSTHTAFILDDRMAKTPDAVSSFLVELKQKLEALVEQERAVMLAMKEEECKEHGLENSGRLELWDMRYYMDMVEKKKYAVDHTLLREYFPLPRVLSGMFKIYQMLLGVTFEAVAGAPVWHQDAEMHSVTDTESGELLGYFFLDLHPRPGKYSHAAVFPLQPNCKVPGQERQVSVCGMLCNFSKPSADKPALLEHSEVETLFHEFGHVMHHVCSLVQVAMFSGTSVARDFVEAPSQMLENWVWEKEPLALMSEHYKTGAPIPDELLSKLVASRQANAGFLNMRQVALATYDQTIHSKENVNTAAVYAQLHKEITGFEVVPDTNMPASFGHLGGGYDAQYYGYLWSEVFSMDMFMTRFHGRVMDSSVGREYRRIVLQRGNTIDAGDILKEFLGREPSNVPFLRSKGLEC